MNGQESIAKVYVHSLEIENLFRAHTRFDDKGRNVPEGIARLSQVSLLLDVRYDTVLVVLLCEEFYAADRLRRGRCGAGIRQDQCCRGVD